MKLGVAVTLCVVGLPLAGCEHTPCKSGAADPDGVTASEACPDYNICAITDICVSPKYVDNGDDTISDGVTGLVWQKIAAVAGPYNGGYSWNPDGADPANSDPTSAQYYCANLNLGGKSSGWRLPVMDELFTLVDVQPNPPMIDTPTFVIGNADCFWTSSVQYPDYSVWIVSFVLGDAEGDTAADSCAVRCVR